MRLRSRPVSLLVGLCLVGALAACTPDDPEPTPSPTATESAAATPTPTPTTPPEAIAPERPAEMDEVSVAGAEAVTTYFLKLYPYVYATGDLTQWRALSDPECVFCNSVIGNVEAQVASGHTSAGSSVDVSNQFAWEITEGRFGSTASITEGPSAEFDADGALVSERTTTDHYETTFALQIVNGGWTVLEVDIEPAAQ